MTDLPVYDAIMTLIQEANVEMAALLPDGVEYEEAHRHSRQIVRDRRAKAAAERDAAIEKAIAP